MADNRWDVQLAKLIGTSKPTVETGKTENEEDAAFSALLKLLPDDVAQAVNDAEIPDEDWSRVIEHRWCLTEMPEGEYPRQRVYSDLTGLLNALAKREGTETAVAITYGVPLRLTKQLISGDNKKLRFLLLPNQMAVPIESGSVRLIEQSVLPDSLEMEEEGWLGPQEFLQQQKFFMDAYEEKEPESESPTDDPKDHNDEDEDGFSEEPIE